MKFCSIFLGVLFLVNWGGVAQAKQRVSLMTVNAYNLFDTYHDEGKNDFTYLPLKVKKSAWFKKIAPCRDIPNQFWKDQCEKWDYNDSVVRLKLERLSNAIFQEKGARGPDIIFLQEVENKISTTPDGKQVDGVTERLRKTLNKKLKAAGHPVESAYINNVHIEGNDARGIDVAVITRLPVIEKPILHQTWLVDEHFRARGDSPYPGTKSPKIEDQLADVRGLLQVTVKLPDGRPLTLFAVHFPAQHLAEKDEEGEEVKLEKGIDLRRPLAVMQIDHLQKLIAALPEGRMVAVSGDFNLSGYEGKKDRIYDRIAFFAGRRQLIHTYGKLSPIGTYFYRGGWNPFDEFLLSISMTPKGKAPWIVDPTSLKIANDYRQQNKMYNPDEGKPFPIPAAMYLPMDGKPIDADKNPMPGVSDHWFKYVEIFSRK